VRDNSNQTRAIPAARFKAAVTASRSQSPCHVPVSLQSYPAEAKKP
jgi:hypothetical protein